MVCKIERFGDISLYFPCPNFGSLYLHRHYLFCDLPLTPCWYISIQIHIISMPPITVVSMGAPRLSKCKKKSGRCSKLLVSLLVEIVIKIYFWIHYLSTRIYDYLGTEINPRGSKKITQTKNKSEDPIGWIKISEK